MSSNKLVYFDNAATSFPKPAAFYEAFSRFYNHEGGNPGRSGHRFSIAAGERVEEARETIAKLFNIDDPFRIIFTHNASYALNIALTGILEDGDRVITTTLEHNSIARPLRMMQKAGKIELEHMKCDSETGIVDLENLESLLKKRTKLVAFVHGSNVSGTIQPLEEITELAHRYGAYVLADCAQTAGTYKIDIQKSNIDMIAFTGHKGLFGPQGTGGLYVRPGLDLKIVIAGGTGSKSEEDVQPEFMPDRLEIGTPNAGGLASLAAGVNFVLEKGVENIHSIETELITRLIEGLKEIKSVRLVAPDLRDRLPVASFRVDGKTVSEVGYELDENYGICVRVGLHCSPWAHQTFGTFPEGTVRASLSVFNTEDEVDYFLKAMKEVAD